MTSLTLNLGMYLVLRLVCKTYNLGLQYINHGFALKDGMKRNISIGLNEFNLF